MKKIVSVLLAVMMLFAVTVPAFAGEITEESSPASGSTPVKTNYDDLEASGGYYTVTYPAVIDVKWGAEQTAETYDVETQLIPGATLNVTVASVNSAMKNAGGTQQLPYTVTGDTNAEGIAAFASETKTIQINVTAADWENVPIEEYTDNLTFEAEVVMPTP